MDDMMVLLFSKLLVGVIIMQSVGYLVSGFLLGKTMPRLTIATISICAFLALLLVIVLQMLGGIILSGWSAETLGFLKTSLLSPGTAKMYCLWLLYVACATVAAYVARRGKTAATQ